MYVIGLSGKIGSGKTTVAEAILNEFTGRAVRVAFGDVLKEKTAEHYGFDVNLAYSQEGKQMLVPVPGSIDMQYDGGSICDAKFESITVREALQRYGEEMRQKNKLHWIEALFEKMHDIARRWTHWQDPVFVIDDVRRINEAEFVLDYCGGMLFRIETFPGWQAGKYADHISETELDDYERFTRRIRPPQGAHPISTARHILSVNYDERSKRYKCVDCCAFQHNCGVCHHGSRWQRMHSLHEIASKFLTTNEKRIVGAE